MRRLTALILLFLCAASASAQQSQRAGEIRALVPTGQIQRTGVSPIEAQREAPVFWQDVLRTGRAGRMRVGLLDGSILNVGAESQLQIRQHDPSTQNTEIDLAYGRLRAKVAKLSRPGAGFRVRTLVANAGVVGTRFAVRVLADYAEILCLEGTVRARNRDESVAGEVLLRPGEFTRVFRGQTPTPAEAATEAQKQEAEDETDLPATPDVSRVEISWPPAGCGERADLLLRGWSKQMQEGREVEVPVDAELLSGSLRLGTQTIHVEGGRASLDSAPGTKPTEGAFTPRGGAAPVQTKLWDPLAVEPGEGWRAPRAVFVGSAFYVLGPMGFTGGPSFTFGQRPATLLWQGPCGAGFLAPQLPGAEYDVTLALGGAAVARGKMNLIEFNHRAPVPPTVLRGQETSFGTDVRGLAGLERFTEGRPILTVTFTNQAPAIIGNLRSSTPGARSAGETIIWTIQNSLAGGAARLEATARGRMAGAFNIGVAVKLDDALEKPRTPLAPIASP